MHIKDVVKSLILKYNTNNPKTIAQNLGIQIIIEPLGNVLGFYHTYKRIKIIHLNDYLEEYQHNFVLAHELGHAILHPKLNTFFLKAHTYIPTHKIETQANTFAVELLLPDKLLKKYSLPQAAKVVGVPEHLVWLKNNF